MNYNSIISTFELTLQCIIDLNSNILLFLLLITKQSYKHIYTINILQLVYVYYYIFQ